MFVYYLQQRFHLPHALKRYLLTNTFRVELRKGEDCLRFLNYRRAIAFLQCGVMLRSTACTENIYHPTSIFTSGEVVRAIDGLPRHVFTVSKLEALKDCRLECIPFKDFIRLSTDYKVIPEILEHLKESEILKAAELTTIMSEPDLHKRKGLMQTKYPFLENMSLPIHDSRSVQRT
jgi:hypothetical protein